MFIKSVNCICEIVIVSIRSNSEFQNNIAITPQFGINLDLIWYLIWINLGELIKFPNKFTIPFTNVLNF